jgi:hypothetical protein
MVGPRFSKALVLPRKASLASAPRILMGISTEMLVLESALMCLKQFHVYHPPVITIFIGGMVTIPSHGFMAWF